MSRKKRSATPVWHEQPLARAAKEAGGVLVLVRLPKPPPGMNGGCGSPTHVVGTNGGTMPCGAFLNMLGKRAPYYCAACSALKERKGSCV